MGNKEKITLIIVFFIYVSLVMFCCLYSFSSSNIDMSKHFLGIRTDRYIHFTMFLPYPFVAWPVCKYATKKNFWKRYAIPVTLFCGIIFAALTEICQSLITTSRTGDILDFAADSTGIVCGTIIVYFTGHFFSRIISKFLHPKQEYYESK